MTDQKSHLNLRFFVVLVAILLLLFVFVGRLFYLSVIKYDYFSQKSLNQIQKIIKIDSHRGRILDRNNQPLALSKQAYSVYVVPPKIKDKKKFAKLIAPALHFKWQSVYKTIDTTYPFVWLRRKVDQSMLDAVKALDLDGVNYIREEKRIYPNGVVGSDILGFVGMDGGLGGLEYQYNKFLSGSSGKIIVEGDPRGYRLATGVRNVHGRPTSFRSGLRQWEPASFDGGHLVLTIDSRIQYMTQKFLREGVEKTHAKSGVAIVMNPKTGDVLAMADYPDFDPNTFLRYEQAVLKNSSVVDIFEPGSVFKLFLISAALEEKVVTPGTVINVPETLKLYNRVIKEAHRRKEDESSYKTATQIIQESLNVGTTMIAQRLGEQKYYKYLKSFGFGQRSGIKIPGESSGILRHPKDWSKVDIGMISFGQGIGVTALQLASSTSAIANRGVLIKPRIVKYVSDNEGVSIKAVPKTQLRRVISKKTAQEVLDMMEKVVNDGTGGPARIRGYRVGGKTGTAQKARPDGKGYLDDAYVASFVGTFPLSDPEIVILVSIDSPQTSIWGSTVAAPVFRKIAKDLINYLNIPPDK